MTDFLLEFYSEEMPASFLERTVENIKSLIKDRLEKENIKVKNENYFFTPKRITIIFYGLKLEIESSKNFIKGPRYDSPEKAVIGFAASLKTKKSNLIIKNTEKGKYFFFNNTKKPNLKKLLQTILETELKKIAWKKSMKWGANTLRWARPLKNILCLFGNKKLLFSYGHLSSTDFTLELQQLVDKKYKVNSVSHYFSLMKQFGVMISQEERRKNILLDIEKTTHKKNLFIKKDIKLLHEVSNLVEKPYIFLAKFRESFLKLPSEILIITMKKNQKYFPLYDSENNLSSYFILVSNNRSSDNGKTIIEGNQRVVNARLEDALFFWERDNKKKLQYYSEKLNKIIFHSEIGSIYEKVLRLEKLALFLSQKFKYKSKQKANLLDTIHLLKNDLATEVVQEFPELQGIMGAYYAKESNFNKEICNAIYEQYKPLGPSDNLPSTDLAKTVALIDKIDTLVGFFIIDRQPTSSKDPLALRRTALGIIRIIIEGKINLNLTELILKTLKNFKTSKAKNKFESKNFYENISKKIIYFFLERYENLIKETKVYNSNLFKSLQIDNENVNLLEIEENLAYLNIFFSSPAGIKLLGAVKRVINFIGQEENMNKSFLSEPNKQLFQTKEELILYEMVKKHTKHHLIDYDKIMNSLIFLIDPIEKFFDNVQIHHHDATLKKNRLELLSFVNNKVNKSISFLNLIKGN